MQDKESPLDFDLSFLSHTPSATRTTEIEGTKYKTNWKNIAIIGAIGIGAVILIAAGRNNSYSPAPANTFAPTTDSNTEPSGAEAPLTNAPSTDNGVSVGNFRCSNSEAAEADQLKPTEDKAALDAEKDALDQRQTELDDLKSRMAAGATNEYSSQEEIDSYNAMVDDYNSKLTSLKSDIDALQQRLETFNSQVNAYNNYLQLHCTTGD